MPLEVVGIQQFVSNNVDRLFKAIHHKPMRVETVFSKPKEHGGTLVEDSAFSLKYATGTTRRIRLFNYRHMETSFGQQTGGCQPGQPCADYRYVVLHAISSAVFCIRLVTASIPWQYIS